MPLVSFPPPPSSNATHALATAILNYKSDWAKIALEQGADIFAKGHRGETLLAEALTLGLRASKSREKSVSGRRRREQRIFLRNGAQFTEKMCRPRG